MTRYLRCALLLLAIAASWAPDTLAEPYLAVYKGMQCASCHSHPAGGGKRSVYGNAFAQVEQPIRRYGSPDAALWTGNVVEWLSVGGNFRAEYRSIDVPGQQEESDFEFTRGTVYADITLLPNRLTFYADQLVAPGSTFNREAYAKLNLWNRRFYIAGGRFFLPFGLRLQDDSAFVRQASGINFNSADRGFLAGYESGPWSAQLAVTNGTAGGPEVDNGKQVSLSGVYTRSRWRVGASLNVNNAAIGDREMAAIFGGLRTGPVAWLAEVDFIEDELPGAANRNSIATLLEANWRITQGHNLKFGYEYFDPNDDISEDHQVRYSIVWEVSPLQMIQGRLGVRLYDGIPQDPQQNRDVIFAELHAFF